MGEGRGDGVARPVVREKGLIRGEEEERGSSEDGETLVLNGSALTSTRLRADHYNFSAIRVP